MLHVLDVRDAMDSERFQQVQFDPMNDPKKQIVPSASTVSVGGAAGAGADGAEGDKDQGECAVLRFVSLYEIERANACCSPLSPFAHAFLLTPSVLHCSVWLQALWRAFRRPLCRPSTGWTRTPVPSASEVRIVSSCVRCSILYSALHFRLTDTTRARFIKISLNALSLCSPSTQARTT